MGKAHSPRHGSMQFWPRKRAKKLTPRLRSWRYATVNALAGFLTYKAGMLHVLAVDNRKNSMTKGLEISIPVTVLEAPNMKVYSVRFYKATINGLTITKEFVLSLDKLLSRKVSKVKKLQSVDDVKQHVQHVQEKGENIPLIGVVMYSDFSKFWKKTPELLEFKVLPENLNNVLEKPFITVKDVVQPGMFVDVHAVSKGKGFQGPVKRFGISLKQHKSEKGRRAPGSLGPWNAQGKIMWRVAKAGQHGFHLRTERNKLVLMVGDDANAVTPASGFHKYGVIRNNYVLLAGSVPGPAKRQVVLTLTPKKQEPLTISRIVK